MASEAGCLVWYEVQQTGRRQEAGAGVPGLLRSHLLPCPRCLVAPAYLSLMVCRAPFSGDLVSSLLGEGPWLLVPGHHSTPQELGCAWSRISQHQHCWH